MPTTHTVNIEGMMFVPDPLTINVGDSVQWTNASSHPHTATFDFSSTGRIEPGATSSAIAFDQASGPSGFIYFCEIHPEMLGTVNVLAKVATQSRVFLGAADGGRDGGRTQEYPKEVWEGIAQQVAAAWVYDMADDFAKAEQVHGDTDTLLVKSAWERVEKWWADTHGGAPIRNQSGSIDESRLLAHSTAVLESLGRKIRGEYRALGRLVFQFPHPARPDDSLEPGEMFAQQSSDPFGKAITVNFIPRPIQDAYMNHQDFAGAAFRIEVRQDANEPVPDAMKAAYRQQRAKMSVLHYKILAYHQVQGLQALFGGAEFDHAKFAAGLWRMTKRGEWDSPTFVGWHWLRWIQGYIYALEHGEVIDLVKVD